MVLTMSVVIGVRVPKELKKKLDELGINYSEEIRKFLEELVFKERMRRVLEDVKKIRKKIGKVEGNLAVEFVREDRDGR